MASSPEILSSILVVGSSDQIPDDLRAYHLISIDNDGGVVLSLHDGVAYSGALTDLSPYRDALSRMVGSVLRSLPPALRGRARGALVERWNRIWAVARLREACTICDHASRDGEAASLIQVAEGGELTTSERP